VFLEKIPDFDLPLTEEGSNCLESLGIKEYVLIWKQLYDKIKEELKSEDEDDQSIWKLQVMLLALSFLDKDLVISLLNAL
jgi:hypothetical protein